jgi:hypothetical protein
LNGGALSVIAVSMTSAASVSSKVSACRRLASGRRVIARLPRKRQEISPPEAGLTALKCSEFGLIDREVEELIVRMAKENRSWGYDRIVGALANLGHEVSDQTVGNVLRRHGLSPAPERKHTTTWAEFIRAHLAVLAGTDFFTAEVLTLRGLVTYYVLFFIHLESRKVDIAGITVHPNEPWMQQMARNVTMEACGILQDCCYLLHDRDTKYTLSFRAIIKSGRVEPLALPAHSPNLNAYAERWVRSVKEECLSKIILFGERSLRRALSEYVEHYHGERNHQGKSNVLLFSRVAETRRDGPVQCRDRLGGLSLPNTRFVRIDGVARRGSEVRQHLRTARSRVCRAGPSRAKDGFARCCNRRHNSQEFFEGALR